MSNIDETIDTDEAGGTGSGFPKWLKWGLLGALGILVVGYGLIFLYAKVLNDSPDEFDESDLAAALEIDDTIDDEAGDDGADAATEATDPPAADPPATDPPADAPATTEAAGDAPAPTIAVVDPPPPTTAAPAADGDVWIVTGDSELGYRIEEILFGVDTTAVGRTNQIEGSLTIDGTTLTSAEFVVDVGSIESDDGRRDGQFRGRIMTVDEFPTATFTLTEPIELGTEPVDGAAVSTTATGDLTLRGVTNSVTFDLSAELGNGRLAVLGNIPVVFADYSIENPSFGGVTTEDNGLLEFVLVFDAA